MDDSRTATVRLEPNVGFTRPVLGAGVLVGVLAMVFAVTGNWLAALVLLGVVAIALAALGPNRLRAIFGWKRPELVVDRSGYALGSQPTLVYLRKPRRLTDVSDCRIVGKIVCVERVTYQQGTTSHTETHTVFEQQVQGSGEGTSDGLRGEVVLDISAHAGAPTFDLGDNEVRWSVELGTVGARLPRDKHTFVIDVTAALDERYLPGLQDL